MALYPRQDAYFEQSNWPRRGKTISEEEFHELERLSPDCKYEYINGVAYMMSGGSIERDLIRHNMEAVLARQLRHGPGRVFGVDVQVLLGKKRMGNPTMSIQRPRFRVIWPTNGEAIRLSKHLAWLWKSYLRAPKPGTAASSLEPISIVQRSRRLC